MAGFELYLDASQLKRGAQDAGAALVDMGKEAERGAGAVTNATDQLTKKVAPSLTSIGATATRTAASFTAAGDSMQRSLGAAGAGSALASSIGGIASALQQANTQAAALAGSNALASISRLGIELSTIAANSGRLGGALGGALSIVSRATPWLALASAAASVASAFVSSASASDQATKSIKDQADAIEGLIAKSSQLNYARGLGLGDPRQSTSGIGSALQTISSSDRLQFTAGEAAGMFGLTDAQFRELLARDGVDDALDTRRIQGRTTYTRDAFSPTEVRFAGERLLRERQSDEARYARSTRRSHWEDEPGYGTGIFLRGQSYQGDLERSIGGYYGPAFDSTPAPSMVKPGETYLPTNAMPYPTAPVGGTGPAEQMGVALQMANDFAAVMSSALGQAISQGKNLGDTLRDALAGAFAGAAQSGLRSAGSSLVSAIFGGFGTTAAQRIER